MSALVVFVIVYVLILPAITNTSVSEAYKIEVSSDNENVYIPDVATVTEPKDSVLSEDAEAYYNLPANVTNGVIVFLLGGSVWILCRKSNLV